MGAGTGKLNVDVNSNPVLGSLTFAGTSTNAQLSGTPSNVVITAPKGTGTIEIKGVITVLFNGATFTGTYQTFTSGGVLSDKGNLSLNKIQSLAVITDNPTDGNRASIAILPPDFFGAYLSNNSARGAFTFHHEIGRPRLDDRVPYSEITGGLRLQDMTFSYTMTFQTTRNSDGNYPFVLIGTNDDGTSPVPWIALNGAYFPATRQILVGSLRGIYQLIGLRSVVDVGRASLLQVP